MQVDHRIIRETIDSVPGRTIAQVLGLVRGIEVTNRRGNPERRLEAADTGPHEAYDNLIERAISMGANAVVAVDTAGFVAARGDRGGSPVDREYAIYGTAVVLE